MDRSSSWTNTGRNADYVPPSRVARMAVPSPRPPPGSTAEAVATARRSEYGAGGSILPVLPSASPNASKRSSWTTPRSPPGASGDSSAAADDDFHASSSETYAPPPRRAELAAARRVEPVARQRSISDGLFASETEQAQLAYMEQMYGTINLLNAELETERRHRAALETAHAATRSSTYAAKPTDYLSFEEDVQIPMTEFDEPPTGFVVSQTPVAPAYSPRKLRTMPSPPSHPPQSQHRAARPPVSPRAISKEQDEELCATLGKNAELRIRSRDMERTVEKTELELELARKQIKMAERRAENREEKLRALLKEKLNWQKELKATRAQVVEEKMRQVDLFREVEAAKRHFTAELEAVEQELRSAQEENTQLRTHAAEMKAQINFQTRKMDEMARQAQDEKARFVAMIEDTRHRFREWKEGEAEALQEAHDQVVRNLKTEYDLKIERHQDEKQKLRDKVNDLEVSMRLLQKDRALSPLELSLRKAAILGSKENTGAVAAEHIETQSRILELENLLAHSQEYQARQESIIKLSEATISRLMQEREVTALENLSLHPFGVEPQPRGMEALSYETHAAGYVTAPSSPARPPGTPPRGHQLPVKSNEPSVVRSPKSRAHTPRRADLEASIAQAAEQERATNQSVNAESAAPSSREQSLMEEMEQLRKALAEAHAKAEAAAVSDTKQVDTSEADTQPSVPPLSETVEPPVAQDNGKADESVETMIEIKTEDTPEAEDEKHASDIATKVPCESPPPADRDPCQDADGEGEEGHSDTAVSDVVSADEIPAPSATAEDVEDSREAALSEPELCESESGETPVGDGIIAATEEGTQDSSVKEEEAGSSGAECSDEPIDNVDAQEEEEEDEQPPCSEAGPNGDADNVVAVADSETTEGGSAAVVVDSASGERSSKAGDLDDVDASLQLGAEALADASASLVVEHQDEGSKGVVEQENEALESPSSSPEAVDTTAAEVMGDENVEQEVTVGALQTEVDAVTVDEHEAGDGHPTELQESGVDVPAHASDIEQGNAAVADDTEITPDSQVSEEDPCSVIGSQRDGGDTNGEAAEEFDLETSNDIPGQREHSGVLSPLADEHHTDPHDFDSSEALVPVADDFDASTADALNELEPSDVETDGATTSSDAVESDISMACPAENGPGLILESSEDGVVEPSEEQSTRGNEAPSESVEDPVEIDIGEHEIEENATRVAGEACEEVKPSSADATESELVEIEAGSVEFPAENDVVEQVAVLDDAQEAAIERSEDVSTPSDSVESESLEFQVESVEIPATNAIAEDDSVENVVDVTVDSCEDEPNEVEFAAEAPTESTECPAASDFVEMDGVDDGTLIAAEVRTEAPDTSPVIAGNEPVEVSTEFMEFTADNGAVEDANGESGTQVMVERCDEAPSSLSDDVQRESVEIPAELLECTTETMETGLGDVELVEDAAQSEVGLCIDALLATVSEASALEVAPEGVEEHAEEEQVLADSLDNVDNDDQGAKGMEEDDEEAKPAENTALTDAEAPVREAEGHAELSAEPPATCEDEETKEAAPTDEEPSEMREEVEPQDTTDLPELPPQTPEACVAKAVVELVERTALAFVASLHEASHSVLDALADSAGEEVPPPAATVVSEVDGVEPNSIDVLEGPQDPVLAADIDNEAVYEAPVVSESEGDNSVDVKAPETAGGQSSEVNAAAAEELLAQTDDQPELSIRQEAETESVVALATKDFAESFVRDVLEMFATPTYSNENQESDEAATAPDEEAITVELSTISTEVPLEHVAVEAGAYDAVASVTEDSGEAALDTALADDEVNTESSLATPNANDSTGSTRCEVLERDESVDFSDSNPVPDDDRPAEQADLVADMLEHSPADHESGSTAEQVDETNGMSASQFVSAVDALTVAQEFVADVETRALSTILSWLQHESGSESAVRSEYWDNEELESNSTRSIIDSWNMSEEQNEINTTTNECEVPAEPSSQVEPAFELMEDADIIEEVARLLVREVATDSELSTAVDAVENVASQTDFARGETTEYEELLETDSKSERGDAGESGTDVVDAAEPTALGFSTQEIVADVACLLASQAIAEALNRLTQPCSPSEEEEEEEEEEDNQVLNETSNSGPSGALNEDEAGAAAGDGGDDSTSNADEAREIQVDVGSVEDAPVCSSEEVTELPQDPNEQVVDEANNTNYDEFSPPESPSGNPVEVTTDVGELVESMVVIVAESEVEVSSEERSELVASPLPAETDLRVEMDVSSVERVPPDELVCTNDPLPAVETEIAVDGGVPSVNNAEELQIESGGDETELVLAEMIDNVMEDQNSETSDVILDPLGSRLDSDDMEVNSSLEDSSVVDQAGEIADAVDERETSTAPGPEVESQGDTQTLCVDESPAAIESGNDAPQEILPSTDDSELMNCDTPEPTELVHDMEENVPSAGIGVLEQSIEDAGDQADSAVGSDNMDAVDAILGDIVTAIESCHQVDEPVSETNIPIPPSEPSESLPLEPPDEVAESCVVAADEVSTPEADADQAVEEVDPSGSIEPAEDSCQLSVEGEDIAVAQAVEDLLDAVAACVEVTTEDTASLDAFEAVADSSFDVAVQSGVKRVLADLCASVERRHASRHGGRARSVHFAGGTKDGSFARQKDMRRSVLLWEAPVDTASTKESVESAAKRRASRRRVSRRTLADLLAFPTELARFTSSDTTLLAYDARLEQGPVFSLLDQSILTINPDGRHIHLDDQDERLGSSKMIGKRRTLTQELHSKNLALRQIPRFNYMPMSIKFQWSDFVVATPVRPSNINFGEGHNAKSPPIEPMRLLQKKGAKLPCGSYVIVSAFVRPLEDGNENLRVQIYDAERVEEFQFDFSEDIMKKYHLESTGMEAQSLEFLGHLEFRRDEDTIIIKLPEKKAGEGSKTDPDRIQSERTMVGAGDSRKKEPPSKQSRMSAYRQKRPASSPAVTSCQDSGESSSSREPSSTVQISDENEDGSTEASS